METKVFKAFVGSNGFDADHLLPSWIDDPTSNCCEWERVMCNSTTGHVTKLSLNNTRQYNIENFPFYIDENIWYVNLSMFQQLKELKTLNLSYNHFNCSIDDQGCESLLKLKKLEVLDLTWNRFNNIILPSLGALISLKILILGSNSMEGSFPIQGFQRLEELDLSDNCFNNSILSSLAALPSLNTLILSYNFMEGSFPNQGFEKLEKLDISFNTFNKSILSSLGALTSLNTLIFKDNYMGGSFPIQELSNLKNLKTLDASYNRFNSSFSVADWDSSEIVEVEFATKYRYNSYKGDILNSMAGIDLSCNELSGSIPQEIGDLHEIRSLNLSHNHITGSIPVSFSNLRSLESLDLGNNNLSGEIPSELVALTFLETFNVSYNNLSGRVLNGAQFGTFDENNYRGNPGLCGEPIHKSCKSDEAPQTPPPSADVEEEDEGDIDMVWFYWSFSGAYVTILLVLAAILRINRHWRMLWFYYVDVCIYSISIWVCQN